ncbi:DUF1456 family protein [Gammaproteobacteria bacterium AS21]
MTNNDLLRRIRYTFDLSDSKMIEIYALGEVEVSREQVSQWLKKDEDADFVACEDVELAAFLNGFIALKRGKKDGEPVKNETTLNNNAMLRKVKIALNLQGEDMAEIFQLADFPLSNHEISAFFRKPEHKNFRLCKDQVLRYFLQGLQTKHRSS